MVMVSLWFLKKKTLFLLILKKMIHKIMMIMVMVFPLNLKTTVIIKMIITIYYPLLNSKTLLIMINPTILL